jgi:hypothetical protein
VAAELAARVQSFQTAVVGGRAAKKLSAGLALTEELARRYVQDGEVAAAVRSASLADELWPSVTRRKAQLEVALAAVGVVGFGDAVPAAGVQAQELLERHTGGALSWVWFGLEDPLHSLVSQAQTVLRERPPGGEGPMFPALPDEVTQGEAVAVGLLPADAAGMEVVVYGPAGAVVQGGVLHWVPARPGGARLVLLYKGEGWLFPRVWSPLVHESVVPPRVVVEEGLDAVGTDAPLRPADGGGDGAGGGEAAGRRGGGCAIGNGVAGPCGWAGLAVLLAGRRRKAYAINCPRR